MTRHNTTAFLIAVFLTFLTATRALFAQRQELNGSDHNAALCLDGFCIGQSITDPRFDVVNWIIPHDVTKEACVRIACRPTVAFRGYPESNQQALAEAVSWIYGWIDHYNILSKSNLEALRLYKYECNAS